MILNFGSLNADIFMQVEKLPTPGDTILCPGYQVLPGGKGANQAAASAQMGSHVKMYGQVGDDPFGTIALEALKGVQVDTSGVLVDSIPTGCAIISVDGRGENIITVGSGANQAAQASLVPDAALEEATTLVLQMEIPLEANWDVLKRAKKNDCRTILNLAPARKIPSEALNNLDYLIMNEIEAQLLGKYLEVPTSSLVKFAEFLSKKFGLMSIITRGEKGLFAYCGHGKYWNMETMKLDAVDTTGAGDTFVGILSALLDQEKDLQTALHYAVVGSGLSCLKQGGQTSVPSLSAIQENLHKVPKPTRVN